MSRRDDVARAARTPLILLLTACGGSGSRGPARGAVESAGGRLHGADALLDADGAALVVHAEADDYRTDPSGNSGARIACGVVRGG